MTGPFGWLVSRCEVVKRAFDQTYFGLDACMANLMRPGMYEAYHHITVPARETFDGTASTGTGASAGAASTAAADSSAKRAPAHVVGTLCENNDWFARVSGSRKLFRVERRPATKAFVAISLRLFVLSPLCHAEP